MAAYGWKVLRVDARIDSLRAANEIKKDQIKKLELSSVATPLCFIHGVLLSQDTNPVRGFLSPPGRRLEDTMVSCCWAIFENLRVNCMQLNCSCRPFGANAVCDVMSQNPGKHRQFLPRRLPTCTAAQAVKPVCPLQEMSCRRSCLRMSGNKTIVIHFQPYHALSVYVYIYIFTYTYRYIYI